MRRKKYPKEALKAGLTKEDLELIEAVENYNEAEFNSICSCLDIPADNFMIKKIVKQEVPK
ncbi:MAG: hypothetical protein ABIB11_00350 [Candidatus Omnitrophota bacterium]